MADDVRGLAVGDVVRAYHQCLDGSVIALGPWLVTSLHPPEGRRLRVDGSGWLKTASPLGSYRLARVDANDPALARLRAAKGEGA